MDTMLKVNGLVKKYGNFCAVDQVSFQIEKGEIYGLLGPNGAGKTSLISCIVGLEDYNQGEIEVFGQKLSQYKRSRLGFVPQELINHGYFSVTEIIRFYAGYHGCSIKDKDLETLLRQVQLFDKRNTKVKQLSGGMKRRLLIAKALSHNPDLILLDEPTAGVDVELREKLWDLVKKLKSEGKSILLTTHYLDEAESLCDRIGILNHGKLLRQGETKKLIKDFTFKDVIIDLNKNIETTHPLLVRQDQSRLEFRIPPEMPLGELFKDAGVDPYAIQDLQIREGNLEEAFKNVLGTDK